jgi:hypothetical protein
MSIPHSPQEPAAQPAGAMYRVRLTKVSSFLVVTQRRQATYTGALDYLEGIARSARTHTLLLGWWGIPFGLIWTPMALAQNAKAMRQVRELAANPHGRLAGPVVGFSWAGCQEPTSAVEVPRFPGAGWGPVASRG